jgi:hypothetical protein
MSALTRSKASRKRYTQKHHNLSEIAGHSVRHRKIKEKQIMSSTNRRRLQRVKAQIDCHKTFDRLWDSPTPTMTRWKAYEYLLKISGVRHISYLDEPRCKSVIMQVKIDFPQLFNVQSSKRFMG